MSECIFCEMAARRKPAAIVYEDDQCLVVRDIRPQAPVHLLVLPRKHIVSLNDDLENDKVLMGHLMTVVGRVAKEQGIDGSGYRTVINTNAEAGQTVFHLHIHVLGGRILHWPPG
ncbi:MAG TPA: histidine triad nucleotide-binding protein [Acidobacteriota bacterium]|nr:histidine triad nucleotide-binding protein [Acidobacteriota bacterium]